MANLPICLTVPRVSKNDVGTSTVADVATQLGELSVSQPRSCPATRSAPSERFGY